METMAQFSPFLNFIKEDSVLPTGRGSRSCPWPEDAVYHAVMTRSGD